MNNSKKKFCQLLNELIEEKKIKKVNFYTQLGITKPYFYDIISGKVDPPPINRQLDMLRVLKPSRDKIIEFFDLAASERGEIPIDIMEQLKNKTITDNLRKNIDYEKLLKNGEHKDE
ncbi:MAG: hypothetical protein IJQ28_07550 [Clostridia bacterium]|nr:hypothetical protein [Clostridia bacterium]